MNNTTLLQRDTLRYKKNSLPANLALLALLFNCLYFCILYGIKNQSVIENGETVTSWFSTMLMGFSIILTLVMLLTNFLASEGIKGYKKHFCIVLLVLAAIQIARIFIYPIYVFQHSDQIYLTYFWIRIGYSSTGTSSNGVLLGIMMLVWLCASAACLIASAVLGYINCVKLEKHMAAIESGEVDMDAIFKQTEEQMVANPAVAAEKEVE